VLSYTVFDKNKNFMTFQQHIKVMFDPLPVNSVLFVMIMIAHCISEYETERYKQENFDGLRVQSKYQIDGELKEEPY